jgi:hypothetical protein
LINRRPIRSRSTTVRPQILRRSAIGDRISCWRSGMTALRERIIEGGSCTDPTKASQRPWGHHLTAYVSTQESSFVIGEVAVDVVVTPAEGKQGIWTLSDRLMRPLGSITEVSPKLFVITADHNSGLSRMNTANFPSLDDAMSAIEKHMKGTCQLSGDSQ